MQYSITMEKQGRITKRILLSKIAQIFDPLGLLSPVLINAKCMMQQIWQFQTSWDETLPQQFQDNWEEYSSALAKINDVHIPRNINPGNSNRRFDLIGFGDASEKAYGAYLVAPVKTISLPRLELNAALVLAKLCNIAVRAFPNKIESVYLWSDSTIVLSWIASSPNLRKTYVANRVTKIQSLTREAVWRHVPSAQNPADLISRGMTVEDWATNNLWWHGPTWLTTGEWPERPTIDVDTSDMRTPTVLISAKNTTDVLRKFSTYEKLERVVAYCLRWKFNTLGTKRNGSLTVKELEHAEKAIVKMTQQEAFLPEYKALKQNKQIPKGSKLVALSPFLDGEGIIRVGGRLSNANIPETQKYSMVLPDRHHVTTIMMRREHLRLHHCGPEQLLHSMRQNYWALSGCREARKITNNFIQCYRSRPKTLDVRMGDLPSKRVQGSLKPFTNTGVDYVGPVQVRESRRRGRVHIRKAWIAVFTCLATKAMHLELVSELTTEGFLATLRRFVARRGICSTIFSDNGSNFVGASRELKEVYTFLENEKDRVSDDLSRQRIDCQFIPPRAPHFGGLWEAAVKSAKKHLSIVTKGLIFTFEEYYTLLVEIESILNSRPLIPLSSDPNDTSALTPSHFLVGDSLLLPAEHSYLEKWYLQGDNLKVGTLVLLKEDNVAPLRWPRGRVVEVHVGKDNIVKVATVRTSSGLFKRAVKKLCPLPLEEDGSKDNIEPEQ
ncbi:uncharacterized protein [Venturia canescens]|uniref:uncharacterized protein n=1 Tax=Venturia canescens TaxID=32260 RepID=UPI001C9D3BF2|nr:uncharacterized protein LOC122417449 [Venturia canescens]